MTNAEGDYQTDNTVFAFVDGRTIGWSNDRNVTSGVEVGSKWLWELDPIDASSTNVTLTYDPTDIDNPAVQAVARKFDSSSLESSLGALAEAMA